MSERSSSTAAPGPWRETVLLLGGSNAWVVELRRLVDPDEWELILVDDVEELPGYLRSRSVRAVLMAPRAWSGRDVVVLRDCREISPSTAVVVMAEVPVDLPLKRAFEHGATTFLRWPASPEVFLEAISSGHGGRARTGGGKRDAAS